MGKRLGIAIAVVVTGIVEWLAYEILVTRVDFNTMLIFLLGPVVVAVVVGFFYFRIYQQDREDDEDDILTLDSFPTQQDDEEDEVEETLACIVISASTHAQLQDNINSWLGEGYRIHHVDFDANQRGLYAVIFYWK
jgi:hypothetical protein